MRYVIVVVAGTAIVASACKSEEAQRAKQAYNEVIDYSLEYKERHTVWKKRKLPGYVWSVRENRDDSKRPSLDIDIAVAHHIRKGALDKLLQEAARMGKGATALPVVRVQAWPKGLHAFGGLLGVSHLAQDGRGWDGQGNTFRAVKVIHGHGKGVWRPSTFDVEVLQALEQRRRLLLADPKNARRRARWLRRSVALEAAVVAQVAPRMGLTRASVMRTMKNARRYWWKPRWQPLPKSVSQ